MPVLLNMSRRKDEKAQLDSLQKKRRLRRPSVIDGEGTQDLVFEYFSATLDYVPSGQTSNFKITASFRQYARLQSFTSLSPTLTYSAMMPENAEIIRRVKANDVPGMLSLLEQGFASITDCDPRVTSFAICRISTGVWWREH